MWVLRIKSSRTTSSALNHCPFSPALTPTLVSRGDQALLLVNGNKTLWALSRGGDLETCLFLTFLWFGKVLFLTLSLVLPIVFAQPGTPSSRLLQHPLTSCLCHTPGMQFSGLFTWSPWSTYSPTPTLRCHYLSLLAQGASDLFEKHSHCCVSVFQEKTKPNGAIQIITFNKISVLLHHNPA